MTQRVRADQVLLARKIFTSRTAAQEAIESGYVLINGKPILKASSLVSPGDDIKVLELPKYVSRGGLKLEKALDVFEIDCTAKLCLDVGASTGGFTDCLLQRGAKHVWAVDVGYGQLHQKLREDARVTVIERTNFRDLDAGSVPEPLDIITVDVSFISLTKLEPKLLELMRSGTVLIALIKPQFEAGVKLVRKGVLRDPEAHVATLTSLTEELTSGGLFLKGLDFSPIKGPKGNIEYLALFTRTSPNEHHSEQGKSSTTVYNVEVLTDLVERAFKETGTSGQ